MLRVRLCAAAVSQLKMQGDFSDAVPFLKRPINLDGEYAGDVGFDPLVSSSSNVPEISDETGACVTPFAAGLPVLPLDATHPVLPTHATHALPSLRALFNAQKTHAFLRLDVINLA